MHPKYSEIYCMASAVSLDTKLAPFSLYFPAAYFTEKIFLIIGNI